VLNLADGRPRLFRSILGSFGITKRARQLSPDSTEMTCVPFSSIFSSISNSQIPMPYNREKRRGRPLNTKALIFGAMTGLVALPFFWLAPRFVMNRYVKRLMARARDSTNLSEHGSGLKPESDFIVEVSDAGATCRRPDGNTESITWIDLQRVSVLTTDVGPFEPDIFWVLYGSASGCVIPWGATGERQLVERLQALPGFRNDVLVNATCLTVDNLLNCWERQHPDGHNPGELKGT
jgi:hypothetical protein